MRLIDADNIKIPNDAKYKDSLKRVIELQPTVLEWIPVSERQPEEKINPITDDYAEYNVTFCCNGKYDTRHYKFGGGHWWNSGMCMDEYVIAWMPLPEPHKPE